MVDTSLSRAAIVPTERRTGLQFLRAMLRPDQDRVSWSSSTTIWSWWPSQREPEGPRLALREQTSASIRCPENVAEQTRTLHRLERVRRSLPTFDHGAPKAASALRRDSYPERPRHRNHHQQSEGRPTLRSARVADSMQPLILTQAVRCSIGLP